MMNCEVEKACSFKKLREKRIDLQNQNQGKWRIFDRLLG